MPAVSRKARDTAAATPATATATPETATATPAPRKFVRPGELGRRFDSAPSNLRMNRLAGRFTSSAPATSRPIQQQHQRHPPKKLKQAAATTSTAMLVSLRPRRTARSGCATCANREIGVPRQTKNGAAPATIRPVAYATWLLGCDERRLSGFN